MSIGDERLKSVFGCSKDFLVSVKFVPDASAQDRLDDVPRLLMKLMCIDQKEVDDLVVKNSPTCVKQVMESSRKRAAMQMEACSYIMEKYRYPGENTEVQGHLAQLLCVLGDEYNIP